MEQEILLYNKEKAQVAVITFDPQTQRLDMKWTQQPPGEKAIELSAMLEKICKDKAVPSLCQRTASAADEKTVSVETLVNVSTDNSKFMAALTDYINRHNGQKNRVFAVLRRPSFRMENGQ